MNLPSRDLLLHSRRNCPPYNKAHFFIDQRWIAPPRSSAYYIAVCAFNKMHLIPCEVFHSAPLAPKASVPQGTKGKIYLLFGCIFLSILAEKVGIEPTQAFKAPNTLAVCPLNHLEYFSVKNSPFYKTLLIDPKGSVVHNK